MSFYQGRSVRLGEIAYRDPIIGRFGKARRNGVPGLGVNTAANIGTGAATGAAIGSVVPVLGTAVGGVVGSLVGAVSSLFGGGADKTGLPRVPSSNANFNQLLATKWYTLYFPRYSPGGKNENAATQASGISYWANQIAQDGPQRAWVNFSGSPQPVQDGVSAAAVAYTPQYGNQYVLAPANAPPVGAYTNANATPYQVANAPVAAPTAVPYTGAVPYTNANATPQQVALAPVVQQAGLLGGVSNTTLLLVGGGLLVGFLLMNKGGGAPSNPEISS